MKKTKRTTITANEKPTVNKVYQIVTDKIIAALKTGTSPWSRPWLVSSPKNIRGTGYRGINVYLLNLAMEAGGYKRNLWLTPNQANELGGKYAGQKTTLVIFWHKFEIKDGDTVVDTKFSLQYYNVLNVEQVEGVEFPAEPDHKPIQPLKAAEKAIKNMPNRPEIRHGGNRAYYATLRDNVQMPPRDSFKKAEGYYSTLFHELGHSTGHAERLGRFEKGADHTFGSQDYSKEELVAEMTASFVMSALGLEVQWDNSTAYIASWLKALENNPMWVVQAASKAQAAADYILNVKHKEGE